MITLTNVELNANLYNPVIFFDLDGTIPVANQGALFSRQLGQQDKAQHDDNG